MNRTVSSKRGSLGEGLWDAFLTNRSQTIFSGPPRYPLYAVYSFEQTVPSKRGSLGEGPWDAFLINRSKSKDPVYLNEVCLNPVYMMPSVWIHSVWMLSLRLWSVWRFTVCLPAVSICPRKGSRLVVWGSGRRGRGWPWRDLEERMLNLLNLSNKHGNFKL